MGNTRKGNFNEVAQMRETQMSVMQMGITQKKVKQNRVTKKSVMQMGQVRLR